jgi:hypothetical protein
VENTLQTSPPPPPPPPPNLLRCAAQIILDRSRSNYAQLLAAQTLLKLVNENSLSSSVRVDMKNYLFGYLSTCVSLGRIPARSAVVVGACVGGGGVLIAVDE